MSPSDESTAELLRRAWFLTGATATGKTAVALELADRLDAEILSLDSMALFRGLDIGTAKPTAEQRARAPHHLLDLVEPTDDFSLARYLAAVDDALRDIAARGRTPLFVGGTPLYLKALLRGVFRGPDADWELRREIERELEEVGVEALHERLQLVDPLAAAKLHPRDKRRIIRALEVQRLTGQPISHLQTQFDEGRPAAACRVFVLQWPRPVLHQRINARVVRMFAAGLLDEVRGLLARYGQLSRTASQAVGYREAIAHLRGEADLPTTIERVQARTRQFARRQEIWFRGLSECRFVPLDDARAPADVAAAIHAAGADLTDD